MDTSLVATNVPPEWQRDYRLSGHRDICAGWTLAICQSGHVASDLEAATEAYKAALQRVTDAVAEVAAARAAVPDARARLAVAIVEAYRAGVRVGEIARVSGYGREQVRRILRAAGVEPAGAE